jgi:RNA polymerase sigma-70 factor (ECF subfamily)
MSSSKSDAAGRHISQIETIWPVLLQAHGGRPAEVNAAQQAILQRYRPAVYRYLLACLGNPDSAEEVFQEFALRLVRGDFKNANPERGRFRDLLKSALYHLMVDHHKCRQRQGAPLSPDAPEPAAAQESLLESDRQFLEAWRADLLNRSWVALAEEERQTGRPLYTVLHFRAGHPDLRSAQLAERLSPKLGKEVSAEWVRKWLHAARERFAELLLAEVAASLREANPDAVEQELIDLNLFEYCRAALERWREKDGGKGGKA